MNLLGEDLNRPSTKVDSAVRDLQLGRSLGIQTLPLPLRTAHLHLHLHLHLQVLISCGTDRSGHCRIRCAELFESRQAVEYA